MKLGSKWIVVWVALSAGMGAESRQYERGWDEQSWRVQQPGFSGAGLRVEKPALDFEASLLLSHHCLGFALPLEAQHYFAGAPPGPVRVDWRVDKRKLRSGVFELRVAPPRQAADLCAVDTVLKNWIKRFAKDVMGIADGAFMAEPPKLLTVRFHADPYGGGGRLEASFDLSGARGMACRHRTAPRKQLRVCDGD